MYLDQARREAPNFKVKPKRGLMPNIPLGIDTSELPKLAGLIVPNHGHYALLVSKLTHSRDVKGHAAAATWKTIEKRPSQPQVKSNRNRSNFDVFETNSTRPRLTASKRTQQELARVHRKRYACQINTLELHDVTIQATNRKSCTTR